MGRKVIALWLSLATVFSIIVIIIEFALVVEAPTIIYVDDVPGEGPDNPAENYTSIQEAINNANPGDTVFVYNGTYYETLSISKTINLTGQNKNTTEINGELNKYTVKIFADYVNVTGFNITDGSGPFAESGIQLNNNQNCMIYNNIFTENNYGIQIYYSNWNWIINNSFTTNFDAGIYLDHSQGNIIEGNDISDEDDGVKFFHSDSNKVLNNTISSSWIGIYLIRSSGNNLTGNILISNKGGIFISLSLCSTIKENLMNNDGLFISGDSLDHWNTHDIDISNTVNGKPVYYWKNQTSGIIPSGAGEVILANCLNIIVGNLDLNNGSVGIELGYSNYNTISNNTISSMNFEGIFVTYSDWNNITENEIFLNDGYGIYLSNSNFNNVTDNLAYYSNTGIQISYSTNNIITGNLLKNNVNDGIRLSNSADNNIVYENDVIMNNDYGLVVFQSSGNRIFHNNVINNTNQASDDRMDNLWNDTYPSGGNYWSDYSGVDDYQGVYQDIPGKDGIGDTNYSIDSDSIDQYPLMGPYPDFPTRNYTILCQGWNLISVPFIQKEQNLTKVLEMIGGGYDAVQWYDITDTQDPWEHYKVGKPYGNDLSEINETMGFWIHITQQGDTIFLYNGSQPAVNQTITLHPGWNMVGCPSLTSHNRTEGLNNLTFGTDVDSIWTYNAATQKWKELGSSDCFEVGMGYWIHAKIECEWEVPL